MEMHQSKSLDIYIDGASRGNPGNAGAGVVIKNKKGEVIKSLKKFLGETTNNVAEYMSLILALKEAKKLGCESVSIYSDSKLMVNQIKGIYKVRDEKLNRLKKKVDELLGAFRLERIEFIPREENREADRLANSAIDLKVDQMAAGL